MFGILVWFKFQILASYGLALMGWGLDPSVFASAIDVADTSNRTPFHDNPNLHGWEWGWQFFVGMHNITGIALWSVCLIPLFSVKGGSTHRRFGRAFVLFWLLHLLDGLVNSSHTLVTRGFDPTNYLDGIGQGFSLYLYIQFGFIAFVVIDFLAQALTVLQYKTGLRGPMRILMMAMPIVTVIQGLCMTSWAISLFWNGGDPATQKTAEFALIYLIQCPAYMYLLGKNIAWWRTKNPYQWMQGWVTEHQRNMMFCVAVSIYTGLANITMKHAPWLTAVLFASVDFGFIAWLIIKERAIRGTVFQSRFTLSLVASLHRKPPRAKPDNVDSRQIDWLMKRFDADKSGTLDANEITALLTSQGIELSEEECAQIMNSVDENGDGQIDSVEFATFFATWILTEPSEDDGLALAFHSLDQNGDGRISVKELHDALGDDELRDDLIEATLRLGDVDSDGSLDWREFIAAMQSSSIQKTA